MKGKPIFVLILLIANYLLGLSQSTQESKSIIPKNFPSDYIVTEYCPSCETPDSLIFYPDRTFIFKLGGVEETQKHYELGIWRKEGNEIKIDIYKKLGIRPIGEPTNPDVSFAGNPEDYYKYELYVAYEQWVSEVKTFDSESLNFFEIAIDTCNKASQVSINMQKYLLNGNYKVASCRLLTNNDLEYLTKEELRIMRNEIFARYNYKFKSIDLQKHFLSKEWYRGYTSKVDFYLTDIEKKNIELILKFEHK